MDSHAFKNGEELDLLRPGLKKCCYCPKGEETDLGTWCSIIWDVVEHDPVRLAQYRSLCDQADAKRKANDAECARLGAN